MKLSGKVNLSFNLSAVPPASPGFSVPGLIVDAPEVPFYARKRAVTLDTHGTVLDTTEAAEAWCAKLWAKGNIAKAHIIRWASTALPSQFVMKDYNRAVLDWNAVTVSGDYALTDGTTTEEMATGPMSGAGSMADVAAIIQADVRTSASFADDLATATVEVDALGNLVLTSGETGEAATTYRIIAPTGGAGTDITTAGFLNIASRSFVVAGVDAEDPDDALTAALQIDETIQCIHEIGASTAQQSALATICQAYGKFYLPNVRDVNAKDPSNTTSIAYILSNVKNSYAYGIYTEHAGDYPSATVNSQILTRPEGSASFANNLLEGVNESGLGPDGTAVVELTADEIDALKAVNCDYLVEPMSGVHCDHGLTFAGIEMKHRVGYSWAERRSAEEIYSYMLMNEVTFSDTDIQAMCGIVFRYIDILGDRKCVSSYDIKIPSAADIALVEQATHQLSLMEIANIISAYAVNNVVASTSVAA